MKKNIVLMPKKLESTRLSRKVLSELDKLLFIINTAKRTLLAKEINEVYE